MHVLVQSVDQNVRAARSGVPGCQHDVSRNLALHVQVELLHSSQFEVKVLGKQCAGECSDGRGRGIGPDRATTQALQENALHAAIERCIAKRAIRDAVEIVRFGEVWRVLPKPLPALIPRGIMEDRVSATDRCVLTLEWLPREADPWLDRSLVQLNSNISIRGDTEGTGSGQGTIPGYEQPARGKIEVCLAILGFLDGSRKGPSEANVQRQAAGNPPIILDERPEQLP